MKLGSIAAAVLGFSLALVGLSSCSKPAGPPPPLALDQIPAALEKAFGQASAEAKELVAQTNEALKSQDYPKASIAVQTLANVPDLTEEQRLLSARAMLAVNERLREAQSKGDEKAAEFLRLQHSAK